MALSLPPPALDPGIFREYTYANFPWPEVRDWLLPQIGWARRIVILDGVGLSLAKLLLSDPAFPKRHAVGVWDAEHASGNLGGVPFLADEGSVIRSRPDLLLSGLTAGNKTPFRLLQVHLQTRAHLLPNLVSAHPLAGSMLVWNRAPGEACSIFQEAFPAVLRESIVRHMARYLLFSGWAKGKEVLDVACGNGYGSHLLSRVASSVTAVDLNEHLVRFGLKHNAAANLRYACADLLTLPADRRFDVITSVETFEHIPPDGIAAFVDALRARLAPEGTLLCTTPLARDTIRRPSNRDHVAEYSLADFTGMLSRGFEVEGVLFQQHTGKVLQELPPDLPIPESTDPGHVVQIAVCRPR